MEFVQVKKTIALGKATISRPELHQKIADKMFVSPRTIDGYRDALFEKLHVKTRVGLVMYAIKNGIVNINLFVLLPINLFSIYISCQHLSF